jgi:hypothetical protein
VASDSVAVLLDVRSVFLGAYASIRVVVEAAVNLGQDVTGDGDWAASHPCLRRNSNRRDFP